MAVVFQPCAWVFPGIIDLYFCAQKDWKDLVTLVAIKSPAYLDQHGSALLREERNLASALVLLVLEGVTSGQTDGVKAPDCTSVHSADLSRVSQRSWPSCLSTVNSTAGLASSPATVQIFKFVAFYWPK